MWKSIAIQYLVLIKNYTDLLVKRTKEVYIIRQTIRKGRILKKLS